MIIHPFAALRPKPEYAKDIAALPYDVVSEQESRDAYTTNPKTFLGVDRPEATLPPNIDPYDDQVYLKGAANLVELANKYMEKESKPAFYIYQLTFEGRSQTGLACLVNVADYDNDKVKKHEKTRPVKEKDRVKHIVNLGAHTGPILTSYKGDTTVEGLLENWKKNNAPIYDFTSVDTIEHKVWVINDDSVISDIENAFKNVEELYIADGHHRAAGASIAHKELGLSTSSAYLSVLFAKDQLTIIDYNRVLADFNGKTKDEFLVELGEKFEIKESGSAVKPTNAAQFGLYTDKKWYTLTAKESQPTDAVGCLPVSILTNNVIEPILGITDQRTDKRIDFVGGTRGTEELVNLVDSGKWALAFSLFPTTMDQLIAVADANLLMPPKSTWFEPKLYSGLLINVIK